MSEELYNTLTDEQKSRIANFYRAGGDVVCETCGKKYYDHPMYMPSAKATYNGQPILNEICNGDLVKL